MAWGERRSPWIVVTPTASTAIDGASASATASRTAAISIWELAASETSSRRRYLSSAVIGGLEVFSMAEILPPKQRHQGLQRLQRLQGRGRCFSVLEVFQARFRAVASMS